MTMVGARTGAPFQQSRTSYGAGGRELGAIAKQRLSATAPRSLVDHLAEIPKSELPADLFNPYPEGFNLNQQLSHAMEGPMLQRANLLNLGIEPQGNVSPNPESYGRGGQGRGPSFAFLGSQMLARGLGEQAKQGLIGELTGHVGRHKLGAYGLQEQANLARMGLAADQRRADIEQENNLLRALAQLLPQKQTTVSGGAPLGTATYGGIRLSNPVA